MELNLAKELARLERMSVGELRTRYVEAFGEQTRVRNRAWLLRRIAWRLQATAEGDLSERARRRAAELANDADLRMSPPRPKDQPSAPIVPHDSETATLPIDRCSRLPTPGTVITRSYKGRTLQVTVLADSFEFEGEVYRSLSAVAKAMSIFDPVWDSLTPREQARVVQLLVERVDYDGASGKVTITFHPSGIKTLADELAGQNTEDAA